MKNIYDILDQIETRPGMYLGNDYGIVALNHVVAGFMFAGGHSYDKKLYYPDFSLFTSWLGGIMKYKYENSSMNWCWLLLDKYKDDKVALMKFFYYLKQFKVSGNEVVVIPITKTNINHAIEHKKHYLWCKVAKVSRYDHNLKKLDKIVLFKLTPSRTLFSLLIDKNNKVLDDRNTDMTGRILPNKIEAQFGIGRGKWKAIKPAAGKIILQQHKII